jgi:hypothetical protein
MNEAESRSLGEALERLVDALDEYGTSKSLQSLAAAEAACIDYCGRLGPLVGDELLAFQLQQACVEFLAACQRQESLEAHFAVASAPLDEADQAMLRQVEATTDATLERFNTVFAEVEKRAPPPNRTRLP